MSVSSVYMPIMTFRDQNGAPVPLAKVYAYAAGTSTPQALYADPAGATPLSNPAICNAAGQLVAYATVGLAYKFDVFDTNDVHVAGWPIDNYLVQPTVISTYTITGFTHTLQTSGAIPGLYGDGGTVAQLFSFVIPERWQPATDMTWKMMRIASVSSGTAVMSYTLNRYRNNTAVSTFVTSTIVNFSPGDTNAHLLTFTIPGASLQAGDTVLLALQRFGADSEDTLAGDVVINSNAVDYTGIASV